ncbi:MAG: hypothetical protein HC869_15845, partial [Rhodospirillales bacterium]|nr:hypothetical protein [Rhodospirillales bacterium]
MMMTGRNIGEGKTLADMPDRRSVEARLAYPLGAAIACARIICRARAISMNAIFS